MPVHYYCLHRACPAVANRSAPFANCAIPSGSGFAYRAIGFFPPPHTSRHRRTVIFSLRSAFACRIVYLFVCSHLSSDFSTPILLYQQPTPSSYVRVPRINTTTTHALAFSQCISPIVRFLYPFVTRSPAACCLA